MFRALTASLCCLILVGCSEKGAVLARCSDAPYAMALAANVGLRHNDIWAFDEDANKHRLTTDHASSQPAFSPDGQRIAFVSGRDGGWEECCGFDDLEIWMMDADGGNQMPLTDGPGDESPSWSPDGELIAFQRAQYANNRGAIYVMKPDGSGLTQLTDPPDRTVDGVPAWSPDGSMIAFVRYERRGQSIWTMNRDGSDEQPIGGASPGDGDDEIAWSPDGQRIAYVRGLATYLIHVGSLDVDQVELTSITPTWLPDGRLAYFDRRQDENGGWGPWQLTVWDGKSEADVPVPLYGYVSGEYTPDWPDCPR